MPGLTNRQANDRRLRQAINYLADEGGDDSDAQYEDAVRRIDDTILNQYIEEGYSYDPTLYQRLLSLVEAELDNSRDTAEGFSTDSDSVEEVIREDGLYRRSPSDDDYEEAGPSKPSKPAKPTPQSSSKGKGSVSPYPTLPAVRESADPSELRKQWDYGGPKNEYEEWHKNFPATLPFGETLFMQEYESLKIHHDLSENAKKKPGDPPVQTDVPIQAVTVRQDKEYDSGSRFKLPTPQPEYMSWMKKAGRWLFNLGKEVEDFNSPSLKLLKKKDSAPRIFLDKVVKHPTHRDSISVPNPPPKSPVPSRSKPSATPRPGPSRPRANSDPTTGPLRPRAHTAPAGPSRTRAATIGKTPKVPAVPRPRTPTPASGGRPRSNAISRIGTLGSAKPPSARHVTEAGPSRPVEAGTSRPRAVPVGDSSIGWVDPLRDAETAFPKYYGEKARGKRPVPPTSPAAARPVAPGRVLKRAGWINPDVQAKIGPGRPAPSPTVRIPARRASRVDPAIRPRGRPSKNAVPVPQAAAKPATATAKGKRKADNVSEVVEEERPKRARIVTLKAKKVVFTGRNEYEGTPSLIGGRPSMASSSGASSRGKVTKKGVAAQGYQGVTRGTTRSGRAFKK
ncbi:hypothetical protein P154DRAFT_569238 [Amniculicola lignicola CBS 123094]|uniref:Uncharacterized protein n=1 Tax=Amniculicola lignicola CBS 123094 TaxID=1392246 RepID=A0A6A5X360_9PLEO|nr:hypothetical protein P154DRAFT_569238 [Amniculicola lignicola CBS 123094]